jgi:drug/metabolite transporter (DMT)-like permease
MSGQYIKQERELEHLMSKRIKADIALLSITLMWGSSYLFTKYIFASGMGEFTIVALRMFIAFVLCLMFFWKKMRKVDLKVIKKSLIIGFFMFIVYAFLMAGINRTTTTNAAFVNSLSVIIVPMLSFILAKRFPAGNVLTGAALAIIGVGLITIDNKFGIGIGELLCFVSAFAEAVHIILNGRIVKDSDPILVAVFQIGFICLFSTISAFIFEEPALPSSINIWLSVLYLSVFSSALPLLIQTKAQQYTLPSHTAIILSMEPVFTTIFSAIIYGTMPSLQGIVGIFVVMFSVFITIIGLANIRCKICSFILAQEDRT